MAISDILSERSKLGELINQRARCGAMVVEAKEALTRARGIRKTSQRELAVEKAQAALDTAEANHHNAKAAEMAEHNRIF